MKLWCIKTQKVWKRMSWFLCKKKKVAKKGRWLAAYQYYIPYALLHIIFQTSLPKQHCFLEGFPGLSHPVKIEHILVLGCLVQMLNDANSEIWFNFCWKLNKKSNLLKEKEIQNKNHFCVQRWAKKDPLLLYILTLLYVVPLRWILNTTSIAFNSNWYNLALMLQYNVLLKLFHRWYLLTDISSFPSQFSSSLNEIVSN